MSTWLLETCRENWSKHIIKKNCVYQVGYLQGLYREALSAKHKIYVLSADCVFVYCMYLTTNSDYFSWQDCLSTVELHILKHSRIPLIGTLAIADHRDHLGPSVKFVDNSIELTCLEITGYWLKYSTVLWLIELQIRCGERFRPRFICFWRDSPQWARASSFTRFLDHAQRRTTVGRTPLWKSDHLVGETLDAGTYCK